MVLGTWYFVLGTWYLVLGTLYFVLCTWYLALGSTWYLSVPDGSRHEQSQEERLGQPGEEIGSRRQNVPFLSHPQRARTQTLGSVYDRSLGHDFIENHRQQSLIGDDHLTEYLLKMLLLRISIS